MLLIVTNLSKDFAVKKTPPLLNRDDVKGY
ncbi:hypothetical protein SAMN05421800_10593 [Chryseobacterium balustinum]|jgi:hypothetical protein|uniref:Uncharacterized protein n=1 Tax=Chryseobacterium balustinum TaxID=246 RepID=A0AAX2IPQ4_9FLAO|nr:hypothetical protein SAMN05421800_10593 [Chryseobacterium balustinum]SQA90758.1 Uncharacterised protein [Chryseobacterium balustinum]